MPIGARACRRFRLPGVPGRSHQYRRRPRATPADPTASWRAREPACDTASMAAASSSESADAHPRRGAIPRRSISRGVARSCAARRSSTSRSSTAPGRLDEFRHAVAEMPLFDPERALLLRDPPQLTGSAKRGGADPPERLAAILAELAPTTRALPRRPRQGARSQRRARGCQGARRGDRVPSGGQGSRAADMGRARDRRARSAARLQAPSTTSSASRAPISGASPRSSTSSSLMRRDARSRSVRFGCRRGRRGNRPLRDARRTARPTFRRRGPNRSTGCCPKDAPARTCSPSSPGRSAISSSPRHTSSSTAPARVSPQRSASPIGRPTASAVRRGACPRHSLPDGSQRSTTLIESSRPVRSRRPTGCAWPCYEQRRR